MLGSPDNGVPVLQTRNARLRRVVMPLLIAVVVAVLVLLLARSGQQSQLIGSGSTLAQPLIERSIGDFRNSVAADREDRRSQGNDWVLDGSGIDYEPVGSLGGVIRLADPEVDFAVTDYALSKNVLTDRDYGQFPVALGAIAVVHNLDLPDGQALRVDASALARIYRGEITSWNDPALAALNRGTTLPDLPVNAVHRTDGSGSTRGFTGYLAAGDPGWASGPGTDTIVEWPAGVGATAERSGGLIAAVSGTPGSIGYAEQGQAARAGLRVAALKNGAGSFNPPSPAGMRAAIADHDWSGADDYVEPLTMAGSAETYPMTVAIYAVLKRNPQFREDTGRTLAYLSFLIDTYDGATADLGYLPLPAPAADAIRAYWSRSLGFSA